MGAGTDAPPLVNGDTPHPPLPDREWETSPLYLALSSRIAKTESTLSSLSSQVAQLSQLVKSALSTSFPPTQSAFSPFDPPVQPSPFVPPSQSATSGPSSDSSVAALTQQIAALSTSVAQLQRLQQSQSQHTRPNSNASNGLAPGGDRHSGPLSRHLHDLISGPLTTPNTLGGLMSPPGAIGSSRPSINRSMSSTVEGDKWGAPNKLAVIGRDWPSPGPGLTSGLVTPSGSGNGSSVLGGAAAPGAGIVVTKWEHLSLKQELLRSIAKYG